MEVCLSLQADFTVISIGVQYWVEARTTAAGVFKLTLHGLNTLGLQWEQLGSVDRLPGAIQSSQAQIQLLLRQVSLRLRS